MLFPNPYSIIFLVLTGFGKILFVSIYYLACIILVNDLFLCKNSAVTIFLLICFISLVLTLIEHFKLKLIYLNNVPEILHSNSTNFDENRRVITGISSAIRAFRPLLSFSYLKPKELRKRDRGFDKFYALQLMKRRRLQQFYI